LADKEEVEHEYGIELTAYSSKIKVDAIIIAVNHELFKKELTLDVIKKHMSTNGSKGVLVDVKGMLDQETLDSGIIYWRL